MLQGTFLDMERPEGKSLESLYCYVDDEQLSEAPTDYAQKQRCIFDLIIDICTRSTGKFNHKLLREFPKKTAQHVHCDWSSLIPFLLHVSIAMNYDADHVRRSVARDVLEDMFRESLADENRCDEDKIQVAIILSRHVFHKNNSVMNYSSFIKHNLLYPFFHSVAAPDNANKNKSSIASAIISALRRMVSQDSIYYLKVHFQLLSVVAASNTLINSYTSDIKARLTSLGESTENSTLLVFGSRTSSTSASSETSSAAGAGIVSFVKPEDLLRWLKQYKDTGREPTELQEIRRMDKRKWTQNVVPGLIT